MYDLIIIGSGPSGLAAALSARQLGLDHLILERGEIANTIRGYPLGKELFSTSNEVELEAGALPSTTKPTREEVLAHYGDLVIKEHIHIRTHEEVRAITPLPTGGFEVRTGTTEYRARAVLVAVGGFGRPRRLQVPGESPERISYSFAQAEPYAGQSILVVGGGNSAAQAALYLAQAGASVVWSLRRPTIDAADQDTGKPKAKIKPWVRKPLEAEAAARRIRILFSTMVTEIRPHSAVLAISADSSLQTASQTSLQPSLQTTLQTSVEIECDHIFALIGADPDTQLLESAGAEIALDGRPVYNIDSYETTVPGLYVAGHMTRELHMKNALEVTPRIIRGIAAKLLQAAAR